MNKKFLLIFGVFFLLTILSLSLNFASAKIQKNFQDQFYFQDQFWPEKDGIYDVPGYFNLRLKVFVHYPKGHQELKQIITSANVCYLQDPDSLITIGSAGWHLPIGIWTYTLNTSSVPSTVGSANLAIMSSDAFNRWSLATNGKVIFKKNSTNTISTRAVYDNKNIIAWGRAPSGALAVTYVWYNKVTGVASEIDTIMNKKYSWSWSNPATWTNSETTCAKTNVYDAQNILTHELGHWMGLNDFYDATNYENATMYGYGSKAEIKKDTLSTGDINGIMAIYP